MIKRKYHKNLQDWLTSTKRKPLLLRGARQVGKSTLVKEFCNSTKIQLIEINLEKDLALHSIFKTLNIDNILSEILFYKKINKLEENSLLFIDEIQTVPEAITALRYFYEERSQLPVIAAGSLIEFALEKKTISVPVGRVEYMYIQQISFIEYLTAKNETSLLDLIQNYEFKMSFPNSAHERLLEITREYFILGGMPEVLETYITLQSLSEAQKILRSISETYRDDFLKYSSNGSYTRIQTIFDVLPSKIGEKTTYSKLDPTSQSREIKKALDLLIKAQVITKIVHSDSNGIPLLSEADLNIYKLYYIDCGLFNFLQGMFDFPTLNFFKNKFIYEGKLAEQFISQELINSQNINQKPQNFYWLREKRNDNAAVDFVVQFNDKIVPIEVKAGTSGSMRSLHQFLLLKKYDTAIRFDANTPSVQKCVVKVPRGKNLSNSDELHQEIRYKLISLPFYMVSEIERIIKTL